VTDAQVLVIFPGGRRILTLMEELIHNLNGIDF